MAKAGKRRRTARDVKRDVAITVAAIAGVSSMGCVALYMGHDRGLFVGLVAIVAGLGGYRVKVIRDKMRGR